MTGGRRGVAVAALVVALAAGGTLIARGPGGGGGPQRPPGRLSAAAAWPRAPIVTVDPAMPDGPLFTPALFLDTTTAIGTAPTPSGAQVRLVLRPWTRHKCPHRVLCPDRWLRIFRGCIPIRSKDIFGLTLRAGRPRSRG